MSSQSLHPSAETLRLFGAGRGRPIVHIGYHKTATTWFQHHVYPTARSHRWIPRKVARAALLEPWGLAFDPEEARRRLDDPRDDRPPVICEENLSGYIHNGGMHGLMGPEAARRIKATLPDAQIVILIRSQPEAIAASYVQYVRGGGTHGPTRYLFPGRRLTGARRHPYKAPAFAFEHFEYDRLIAHYHAVFGAENVLVLPYETLRADADAFLARYAHAVGLQLAPGGVVHRKSNRSFGPATLLTGRLLGLLTDRSVVDKACLLSIPGFYEVRRQVLSLMSRFERSAPPGAILGPRNLAHIEARYADSNARTTALRGLDLSALGYPQASPGYPPAGLGDAAEQRRSAIAGRER